MAYIAREKERICCRQETAGDEKGQRMIQVIKHGTAEIRTTVCNDCGCRFEFTERDAKADESNGKLYLVCPDCGRRFRMPDKSL